MVWPRIPSSFCFPNTLPTSLTLRPAAEAPKVHSRPIRKRLVSVGVLSFFPTQIRKGDKRVQRYLGMAGIKKQQDLGQNARCPSSVCLSDCTELVM